MNRTELFRIARKHGIQNKGKKVFAAIRQELLNYYRSEEGQKEIENSCITVEFNDDFPLSAQPVERVVDLLMMEVEAYARNIAANGNKS